MARHCEICERKRTVGNQITTRGKAKYLGGVGKKVTGISRRDFRPNLQRVRITDANGSSRRIVVCAKCMRSGYVTRLIRNAPFKLPVDVEKAKKS
ncbi:MAG: 50S ribosomal protein L28 [Planctomycetia bacterium]|nr:50S ribosomal protein L28 [Planctomycetia bacterium]